MRFFKRRKTIGIVFSGLYLGVSSCLLSGCLFGGEDSEESTTTASFTISPASQRVGARGSVIFTTSGGSSPFRFSISENRSGGSIHDETGLYTAGSTTGVADIIVVSDSAGNISTATVDVVAPVSISPSSTTVAVNRQISFSATQGISPYTYSVISGGGFIGPSSGIYTASNNVETVTVQVTDAAGGKSIATISTYINVLKVAGGYYHTCALRGNGSVKCWGRNNYGQLGQENTTQIGDEFGEMGDNLSAISLGEGAKAIDVGAGREFSCALLLGGKVKCWGRNNYGQLGQGDTLTRGDEVDEMGDDLSEVPLGTNKRATSISVGEYHACAVLNDGSLKCWGYNSYGVLGQGAGNHRGDAPNEMGDNLSAILLGTGRTARQVSAGGTHTCALLDNYAVKCWGRNNYGQLGQENTNQIGDGFGEMGDNLSEINLGTNRTALSVDASYFHTCALLDNGSVKCWGRNDYGQLGQGDLITRGDDAGEMGDSLNSIDLGTGLTATAVVTHYYSVCASLSDGSVKCWGRNNYGQLGQGDNTTRGDGANQMGDQLDPIDLGSGLELSSIFKGFFQTCASFTGASLKCWGYGSYGILGTESAQHRGDQVGEMGDNLPTVDHGDY